MKAVRCLAIPLLATSPGLAFAGGVTATGLADIVVTDVEAGRRFGERLKVTLGLYNLLGEDASDIRYLYESRSPGEPAPVKDIHFHPVEPRTARLTVELGL